MKIENLNLSFGTQTIFEDLNISFESTDKVGIVGVNGAGKTTLFRLIMKEIEPASGTISVRDKIGYLPQIITDEYLNSDISVFDYLLTGRPIKELQDELTNLYTKISAEENQKQLNKLMKQITKIEDELNYYDVYKAENILLKIITGMNIDENLLDLKLKNLSGGQKSKVAFARLLYSKPEILLLDEPTNHLDLDTKEYITNYLKNYKGLILIISHDTAFLDEITNKTLVINKISHKVQIYPGNYSKYLKIKQNIDLAKQRLHDKQVKEEEKLKDIIRRYIGGNEKKANIAKDRIKKLEKLEKEKIVLEKQNKYARFKMEIEYKSYLVPISCKNLTFGYNEEELLYENLSFDLTRGEKLLIVGENGIGKTTLLKLIMNILKPLEGEIIISPKTKIGYYAQEHEILKKDKTIKDNFNDSGLTEYELRRFLGSFLFTGEDIFKKVENLSPGERARISLAKIALTKANTLLLDEPTNHLDPMTSIIIADTFKDYEGTMLVVSHNLEFVDNLNINRMLLLPSGKIIDYDKEIVMHYELINSEK